MGNFACITCMFQRLWPHCLGFFSCVNEFVYLSFFLISLSLSLSLCLSLSFWSIFIALTFLCDVLHHFSKWDLYPANHSSRYGTAQFWNQVSFFRLQYKCPEIVLNGLNLRKKKTKKKDKKKTTYNWSIPASNKSLLHCSDVGAGYSHQS